MARNLERGQLNDVTGHSTHVFITPQIYLLLKPQFVSTFLALYRQRIEGVQQKG
jgi:hypothetical protein